MKNIHSEIYKILTESGSKITHLVQEWETETLTNAHDNVMTTVIFNIIGEIDKKINEQDENMNLSDVLEIQEIKDLRTCKDVLKKLYPKVLENFKNKNHD